jgi:hypothetical protein
LAQRRDDRWAGGRLPTNADPRSGVCIYEDRDYRGNFQCFNAGDEVADLTRIGRWSDKISSIRVFGPDRIQVFRDIHFQGERIVIDRDVPDLRRIQLRWGGNWDNQITSLFVPGGRGRGPRGRF